MLNIFQMMGWGNMWTFMGIGMVIFVLIVIIFVLYYLFAHRSRINKVYVTSQIKNQESDKNTVDEEIKHEESYFCPNCGEKLDEKSLKYCPSCGSELQMN